jgi:superfamily II DNA/RNA helicase
VINFQCPEDEKVYTHRTGRTGRAGAKGTAVTFVDWDEVPRWQLINKALDLPYPDPAETYSTSPQFYAEMRIPAGVKGVLPRQERVREGLDAEELEDLGETGRGRTSRAGRGSGGGGGSSSSSKDAPKQERPARAPRARTRTRGGQKVAAAAETPLIENTDSAETRLAPEQSPATESPAVAQSAQVAAAPTTQQKEPRKRSRTRKSAAPGGGSMKLAPGSLAGPVDVPRDLPLEPAPEVAPAPAQLAGATPEAGADTAPPRKRTRTRKAAAVKTEATGGTAAAVGAEATGVQDAADGSEADAGPVANPRRTRVRATRSRKTAAAEPSSETPPAQQ